MLRLSVASVLLSAGLLPSNITIALLIITMGLCLHIALRKAGTITTAIIETLLRVFIVAIVLVLAYILFT